MFEPWGYPQGVRHYNILIMNKTKYFLIYNDNGSYAGVCKRTEDVFSSTFMETESRHYVRISKKAYDKIRKIENQ